MERTFKKKSKKLFLLEEYGTSKDMMTKKKGIIHFLVPMHRKDEETLGRDTNTS